MAILPTRKAKYEVRRTENFQSSHRECGSFMRKTAFNFFRNLCLDLSIVISICTISFLDCTFFSPTGNIELMELQRKFYGGDDEPGGKRKSRLVWCCFRILPYVNGQRQLDRSCTMLCTAELQPWSFHRVPPVQLVAFAVSRWSRFHFLLINCASAVICSETDVFERLQNLI